MGIGNFFKGLARNIVGAVRAVTGRKAERPDFAPFLLSSSDKPSVFAAKGADRPSPRSHYSRRDLALSGDAFAVKRKLGRAYFTRGLSPRTRAARLRALKPHELAIATAHRWV